jgi:hypothetical protein
MPIKTKSELKIYLPNSCKFVASYGKKKRIIKEVGRNVEPKKDEVLAKWRLLLRRKARGQCRADKRDIYYKIQIFYGD